MNLSEILPRVEDQAAYEVLRRRSGDVWAEVGRAIMDRHGLERGAVERFTAGEAVVLGVGARVIKLLPPFAAQAARREAEALAQVRHAGLPVPGLVAVGAGGGGWPYLVPTRGEGRPLEEMADLSEAERVATGAEMGAFLARLHAVPVGAVRPGGRSWPEWRARWRERWPGREDVARLPAALRDSGVAYLRAWAEGGEEETVLLHGDLAPVNVLAARRARAVRVTMVIDFGHALLGPKLFDLAAPTVLHGRGERAVVRAMGEAAGVGELTPEVRRRLMAYTMLHPLGDLAECLQLVPGLSAARSWDEVAERFWPR